MMHSVSSIDSMDFRNSQHLEPPVTSSFVTKIALSCLANVGAAFAYCYKKVLSLLNSIGNIPKLFGSTTAQTAAAARSLQPPQVLPSSVDPHHRFQLAAMNGDIETLQEASDEALGHQGRFGTLAHIAVVFDRLDVLEFLADKDIDLLRAKAERITCQPTIAHIAVKQVLERNKDFEVLNFLAERCPDLISDNAYEFARLAILKDRVDLLEWLLERQPGLLGQVDSQGQTLAHYAAENANINLPFEALQWLIEKDPSLLDKKNRQNHTIAYIAAGNGHMDIINFLADNHPNLFRIGNHANRTPAHIAAQAGHTNVLRRLAEIDVDLLRAKTNGNAAFSVADLAQQQEHQDTVDFLATLKIFPTNQQQAV